VRPEPDGAPIPRPRRHPYDYVDLDTNPNAQAQLTWMTGGRVHSPIVSVGGQLLVQPSIAELQWVLARM
jgi:mycoredoxin